MTIGPETGPLSVILLVFFYLCLYKYEHELLKLIVASIATIIFLPVFVYVIGAIQWN